MLKIRLFNLILNLLLFYNNSLLIMQNKIIIYYPSIEFGGMEKNLANLFNELVKKFKVEIITLTIDKKFKEKISKKIFINKKKKFKY